MHRSASFQALTSLLVLGLVGAGALGHADEIKISGDEDPEAHLRLDVDRGPFIWAQDEGLEGFILYDNFITRPGFTEWRFAPTGVLTLGATLVSDEVEVDAVKTLLLGTRGPSQRYLVDSDDNEAVANHIWYQNTIAGTPTDYRMMQITEVSGGHLFVNGPVTQNHSFDLAESFWEREAVEPGELVAVDPERPDAVRRTSAAYQPTLLGVASTQPGVILGGGAFSIAALRRTWGDEVADEYQLRRPELELKVFAEIPELESKAEILRSQSAFAAHLAQEGAEIRTALAERSGQRQHARATSGTPPAESLRVGYEAALRDHQTILFDRTLQRFFDDRFTAVALVGRVPVMADASFGSISPGDYLTSSPVPGVAMKATGPGPTVGTALESLSEGTGLIEVFVHRGWFGGGGRAVAGPQSAAAALSSAKDREIADLRRRLAALEQRLDRLSPGESTLAQSALSPTGRSPSP